MPDPRIWPIGSANDLGPIAVDAVSGLVLAAQRNRQDADFVNTSEYWIYLARGNAAVIGAGIALSPNGGSYHIGLWNLYQGIINGIVDGPDGTLAISEGLL